MNLDAFWNSLEATVGLAAAHAEWQERLGAECLAALSGFMQPTDSVVASILIGDHHYQIVEHSGDEVVGVDENCDCIPLQRHQILVHRINMRALTGAIAKAAGWAHAFTKESAAPGLWRIGQARGRKPCTHYLCIRHDLGEYERSIDRLFRSSGGRPNHVWVPTTAVAIDLGNGVSPLDGEFLLFEGGLLLRSTPSQQPGTPTDQETKLDPGKDTVAKVWTTKDGALHIVTKTNGERDGCAIFALHVGQPTKQQRLMRLLVHAHSRRGVTLSDAMSQLYAEALKSGDAEARMALKRLRSLVSDIRKKLDSAGIPINVLPALDPDVAVKTRLSLRLARIHNLGDCDLDDADDPFSIDD